MSELCDRDEPPGIASIAGRRPVEGAGAGAPLASVIIPAHNEAGVIRRCLDALFDGVDPDRLDVVVVCNGCRDDTAQAARASGHPVRVIELSVASKAAALRAGDRAARACPRLYLDADVTVPGRSALAVIERLCSGAVAARPPIRYDSSRSTALVRRYYRARVQLPAVMSSLWGAGVCGLSAGARARFDEFPDVVADDLWLDLQLERGEVEVVDCEPVVVVTPRRAIDLARMLRRTYGGKAQSRTAPVGRERARETTCLTVRELRGVARSGPQGLLDVAAYAAFAAGVRLWLSVGGLVWRGQAAPRWERDESSRVAAQSGAAA